MIISIYNFEGNFVQAIPSFAIRKILAGDDTHGLNVPTVAEEGSGYTDAEINAANILKTLPSGGKGAEFKLKWYQGIGSVTVDEGGTFGAHAVTLNPVLKGYEVTTPPVLSATLTAGVITAVSVTNKGKFVPKAGEEQSIAIEIESDGEGGAELTPVVLNYLDDVELLKIGGGYSASPVLTLEAPASGTAARVTWTRQLFKVTDIYFNYNGSQKDSVKIYSPEILTGLISGGHFENGKVTTQRADGNRSVIIREEF